MNKVMNLRFPLKEGNFLTSQATTRFLKAILLHGASYLHNSVTEVNQ
jgi:hypothetical protein